MSDLYANITETTQPDSDQAGRHTEIIADLHTGDPAVMAAALRGAADRLDPGDPVEADERAARDAALVAPWREAFRALSGVIPDRHASRAEPAGPRPGGDFLDHFEASIGAQRNQLRALVTDMARQLADAGFIAAGDATLPGALRDALGDLVWYRAATRIAEARATVQHINDDPRGSHEPGPLCDDSCGHDTPPAPGKIQPMYAHDADCNTVHDGPEPCPPPRPPDDVVTVTMTKSAAEYAYSALFKRVDELGHGNIHRAGFAAAMKDVADALRPGDKLDRRPSVGMTDPPTERTYTIQLNRAQNMELLTWLSTNAHGGSISLGRRLTVDAVENGGLLVHARPYRFDDRTAD